MPQTPVTVIDSAAELPPSRADFQPPSAVNNIDGHDSSDGGSSSQEFLTQLRAARDAQRNRHRRHPKDRRRFASLHASRPVNPFCALFRDMRSSDASTGTTGDTAVSVPSAEAVNQLSAEALVDQLLTLLVERRKLAEGPSDDTHCAICLEQMTVPHAVATPCGHVFHSACIKEVLQQHTMCPVCRAPLGHPSSFIVLHNGLPNADNDRQVVVATLAELRHKVAILTSSKAGHATLARMRHLQVRNLQQRVSELGNTVKQREGEISQLNKQLDRLSQHLRAMMADCCDELAKMQTQQRTRTINVDDTSREATPTQIELLRAKEAARQDE